MIKRAVIVGGAGAVGGLFARRLREAGATVTVVDTAEPATREGDVRQVRGDVTCLDFRTAAELGHADLVVLALPEDVALAAVGGVAAELRPDALLVETLSVKQPITEAVRRHAPGVQAVGLNPMFAPSLGFEGRPVAAVSINEGPRTAEFIELVGDWGATVIEVDETEHDRLAAATQALTHAAVLGYGLALGELGIPLEQLSPLAPPPAHTMLALLARITSASPEVYWDVQSANPAADAARKALADGVRRVADLVEHGHAPDFAAALTELRDYLGEGREHYGDTCARLFQHV